MYLRARKKYIELSGAESDEKVMKLLEEESYRLDYSAKNGMLTKGLICSVLLNISTLIDKYGEMDVNIVLLALMIIGSFFAKTQSYNKDLLKDETVQEILLEDIVSVITQNVDFQRISSELKIRGEVTKRISSVNYITERKGPKVAGISSPNEEIKYIAPPLNQLIYILLALLNFNNEPEFRVTVYAHLIQILDYNCPNKNSNNGIFTLEEEFASDAGIKHVSFIIYPNLDSQRYECEQCQD